MPHRGGIIIDRLVTVFQNSAMYQLTCIEAIKFCYVDWLFDLNNHQILIKWTQTIGKITSLA